MAKALMVVMLAVMAAPAFAAGGGGCGFGGGGPNLVGPGGGGTVFPSEGAWAGAFRTTPTGSGTVDTVECRLR